MATAQELTTRFKRKELRRKILDGLIITGAVCIAAQSPYFVFRVMQRIGALSIRDIKNSLNKREKKQCYDVFSDLTKKGIIKVRYDGLNAYIDITKQGKEQLKQYQIHELTIPPMKAWDHQWRVVLFDIPEDIRITRDVLRTKLKEFFGFEDTHYVVIKTKHIGHYEEQFKKRYNLS